MREMEAAPDFTTLRGAGNSWEVSWPQVKQLEKTATHPLGTILAHKLTVYIYNSKALDYLSQLPERRFVLCIRDPRKALVSWHNMHQSIARSGKNPQHFAWQERDFYADCSIADYYERFARDRLKYDVHFQRLADLVSNKHVLVVAQEFMAAHMETVLSAVRDLTLDRPITVSQTETVARHEGFADRNATSIPQYILDELTEVQENLALRINESGVTALMV